MLSSCSTGFRVFEVWFRTGTFWASAGGGNRRRFCHLELPFRDAHDNARTFSRFGAPGTARQKSTCVCSVSDTEIEGASEMLSIAMPTADEYRIKAADLTAQAKLQPSPGVRAAYENLALSYLRLADQADKNAQTDLVYEPRTAASLPRAQQQQQQPQPEKK